MSAIVNFYDCKSQIISVYFIHILVHTKEKIGKRFTDFLEAAKSVNPKAEQKQIASTLGIQPNSITHWKSGKHLPALDTVVELMEKYALNPMYLIAGQKPILLSKKEETSPVINEPEVSYGPLQQIEELKKLLRDKEEIIELQKFKIKTLESH